jgi:hypothetical protein
MGPTFTPTFTPLLIDAARFSRHSPGNRWFVDETYVNVTTHPPPLDTATPLQE